MQVLFRPHKLDVAALGNLVLQLHVQVIARYIDDIAWPRPAWGMAAARPYAPGELIERGLALGTAWPDARPRHVCIPDWRLVTGPKTAPAVAMHQGTDVDRMGSPHVRKTPI